MDAVGGSMHTQVLCSTARTQQQAEALAFAHKPGQPQPLAFVFPLCNRRWLVRMCNIFYTCVMTVLWTRTQL